MLDVNVLRKNKISLEDYNYKQDIQNRLAIAQFTPSDIAVLEEILYNSIKTPIRKLAKNLDLNEEELLPILQRLSHTGLFIIEDDCITIDKDMRKYYEMQILKFDSDFKPGMEFLQSLLKKVPIHVLPTWYCIPRSSNNIFDSIVEKYLLTPHIFQRYLAELHFNEPALGNIVRDLYKTPDLQLSAERVAGTYKLSREQFEEYLLILEFHFVCCLGYQKVDDTWQEVITPFHEWKEYLTFLRTTEATSIPPADPPLRKRPHDFSFIHDMTVLIELIKKQPLELSKNQDSPLTPATLADSAIIAKQLGGWKECDSVFFDYLHHLIGKMRLIKLVDIVDGRLYALEGAHDWLDMRIENRALFLYRHPLNKLLSKKVPAYFCTDRNIREAEKSILRALHSGWIYFEDFFKGVTIPLSEESIIMLKRSGKTWKYSLPVYTEEELALIKATVLEWLFEVGITAVGTHKGRECFCVSLFGQSFFGR